MFKKQARSFISFNLSTSRTGSNDKDELGWLGELLQLRIEFKKFVKTRIFLCKIAVWTHTLVLAAITL